MTCEACQYSTATALWEIPGDGATERVALCDHCEDVATDSPYGSAVMVTAL